MDTDREINCALTLKDVETKEMITIREQMEKIYSVWDGYDLTLNLKIRRARHVWNHIQNLLKQVYIEEDTFYEMYKERIKNYKTKIDKLYNVLQMTPPEPVVGGSWIDQEERLCKELHKLNEEKNIRLEAYKEKRQQKFDFAKRELMTTLEGIEFFPENRLEEDIICNKDTLLPTDGTFKALEEVTNKVQRRKEELEAKKKILIEGLTVLWQGLKVPENKINEFLSNHSDFRLSTFQSIEQEIEKCKSIKSGNIRPYIVGLRTELTQLWDKCCVSQSEKDQFHYFYSTELSVEVLEAHMLEIDKWKKHFLKVEHILKKIDKWKLLWDTLHVLEEAANDPNRFIRPKRNLLSVGKERKEIQKDLPALEENIYKDIEKLKSKDGSKFRYIGEDFKTYVANQRAERNDKKENEKVEKRKKHSAQLENEASVKTPIKRTLSVNFAKSSQSSRNQPKLLRSKTLYNDSNFKKIVPNQRAKSSQKSNESDHKKHFVQQSKDVSFVTPLKRTVTMNFSKTAPSKFFKSLKTNSPFNTPTVSRSKVEPSTVARMASKPSIRPGYLLQKK